MTDWWEGAQIGFIAGFLFSWAGTLFNAWVKRLVARHAEERRAELEKLLTRTEDRGGPRV